MNPVAVTGASGFIGRNLCDHLREKGVPVRAIVRRPADTPQAGVDYRVLGADWEESALVQAFAGCEAVVHLAGRAHIMRDREQNPLEQYRRHNRDLALRAARAALKAGTRRFIFLSTVKVMGEKPGHYFPEQKPEPTDPYGLSKWEAEQGLQEIFVPGQDSRCIVFRIPMVYGPGNKGNMLPLLDAATRDLPLPLAAAKGKRSLIFSGNLVSALFTSLTETPEPQPSLETFFLTDGHDLTSAELYDGLCRAASGKPRSFWIPEGLLRLGGQAGSVIKRLSGAGIPLNNAVIARLFDEYRFQAEHFSKRYNWQPPFSQQEAFQKTVAWLRQRSTPVRAEAKG
ncbi:MAG: NAD-dependent epimerase/dehydratase family protein [Nitrospina sp.]|nr:NAD-dependent epimerase/dehydratase family protein [Nitrospina sp.]